MQIGSTRPRFWASFCMVLHIPRFQAQVRVYTPWQFALLHAPRFWAQVRVYTPWQFPHVHIPRSFGRCTCTHTLAALMSVGRGMFSAVVLKGPPKVLRGSSNGFPRVPQRIRHGSPQGSPKGSPKVSPQGSTQGSLPRVPPSVFRPNPLSCTVQNGIHMHTYTRRRGPEFGASANPWGPKHTDITIWGPW